MFVSADKCSDIFEYFALAYANTKLQNEGGNVVGDVATQKLDYGLVSPKALVRSLSQVPDVEPALARLAPSWLAQALPVQIFSQRYVIEATQVKLNPIKDLMQGAIEYELGTNNAKNKDLLHSTIAVESQHPTNYCAYVLGFITELAKSLNKNFARADQTAKQWAREFLITANHFLFFVAKSIEQHNRNSREFLLGANNGLDPGFGRTHIPCLLMHARTVGLGAIRYSGHNYADLMKQYHWFEEALLKSTQGLSWTDEDQTRFTRVAL